MIGPLLNYFRRIIKGCFYTCDECFSYFTSYPVSILYKSIAGRYRPVRVADGPMTARYRFIKNASWVYVYTSEIRASDVNVSLRLRAV